jgi:hypothetical protein
MLFRLSAGSSFAFPPDYSMSATAARVLQQIAALGPVDVVVVAQPYLAMNVTPATLRRYPAGRAEPGSLG